MNEYENCPPTGNLIDYNSNIAKAYIVFSNGGFMYTGASFWPNRLEKMVNLRIE